MAAPNYPVINGVSHSWADVSIDLNGEIFVGVLALNYSSALEPGEVRGTGPEVLAHTRGDATHEGSLELLKADGEAFLAALGDGFGEVRFTVTASYGAEGLPVVTDRLIGCRIKNLSQDGAQGTDPSKITLDLAPLSIRYQGKAIVKDSLYK